MCLVRSAACVLEGPTPFAEPYAASTEYQLGFCRSLICTQFDGAFFPSSQEPSSETRPRPARQKGYVFRQRWHEHLRIDSIRCSLVQVAQKCMSEF